MSMSGDESYRRWPKRYVQWDRQVDEGEESDKQSGLMCNCWAR